MNEQKPFRLYEQVTPVGTWFFGGRLQVRVLKRPRWLTRKLMKLLLEWEWRDL